MTSTMITATGGTTRVSSLLRAGSAVLGLLGLTCGAVLYLAAVPADHLDAGVIRWMGVAVAVLAGVLPLLASSRRSRPLMLVAAVVSMTTQAVTLSGQVSIWPQSFLALASVVLAVVIAALQAVNPGGSGEAPGRRI